MADPNKASLYAQTYALAMKTIHGDKMKRKERQDIIKARRLLKQMRAELGYVQDPTTGKMKAGKQGNALDQLTGEDVGRWDKNAQGWVKNGQITYYASGQRAPAGTPAPAAGPTTSGAAAARSGGGKSGGPTFTPGLPGVPLTQSVYTPRAANPTGTGELLPVESNRLPVRRGKGVPITGKTSKGDWLTDELADLEQWMQGDVVYGNPSASTPAPRPKRTKPPKEHRKPKGGRR